MYNNAIPGFPGKPFRYRYKTDYRLDHSRKKIMQIKEQRTGVKDDRYFRRDRKLPFLSVFYTILDVGRETLQKKLDRCMKSVGWKRCTSEVSQQAFSKARSHMDHTGFEELFRSMVEFDNMSEELCLCEELEGYIVVAVDGTKVSLPNLAEFRGRYFTTGAGATSPTALASTCVSVTDGRVLDAVWSEKCDERKCAEHHMETLERYFGDGGTTVMLLMDRGYPSSAFISLIYEHGFAFLMRCKDGMNKDVAGLPEDYDGTVEFEGRSVRCVRFHLPSGQLETLLTSDMEMGVEDLKNLYFKRWVAEEKYLTLKKRLELENFTGKTENSVLQDFWATLCADYYLWMFEVEANEQIREDRKEKDNKYEYMMNRSMFVCTLKEKLIRALSCPYKRKRTLLYDEMIEDARKHVVAIRPNRTTPRAKNKRKTEYSFNNKHNC